MTLEDFLVMAGVVAGDSDANKHKDNVIKNVGHTGSSNPIGIVQDYPQDLQWLHQYQQMPSIDQQQQIPQNMLGTFIPGPVNITPSTIGALSDIHMTERKRSAPEDVEDKFVERRQNRMIKNRESAARSRARKLAYTNELENKVSKLEEENDRLKKQKEIGKIEHCSVPTEPKYRLRRTSSAYF